MCHVSSSPVHPAEVAAWRYRRWQKRRTLGKVWEEGVQEEELGGLGAGGGGGGGGMRVQEEVQEGFRRKREEVLEEEESDGSRLSASGRQAGEGKPGEM